MSDNILLMNTLPGFEGLRDAYNDSTRRTVLHRTIGQVICPEVTNLGADLATDLNQTWQEVLRLAGRVSSQFDDFLKPRVDSAVATSSSLEGSPMLVAEIEPNVSMRRHGHNYIQVLPSYMHENLRLHFQTVKVKSETNVGMQTLNLGDMTVQTALMEHPPTPGAFHTSPHLAEREKLTKAKMQNEIYIDLQRFEYVVNLLARVSV